MLYRSDHDAALARVEALEQELAQTKRLLVEKAEQRKGARRTIKMRVEPALDELRSGVVSIGFTIAVVVASCAFMVMIACMTR
jgi:ferric-dicitrate binding protein FerR (iron transport regulator)